MLRRTLHRDIPNECDREHDVVLVARHVEIIFEPLDACVRDGVAVDVVENVHDNLKYVSISGR